MSFGQLSGWVTMDRARVECSGQVASVGMWGMACLMIFWALLEFSVRWPMTVCRETGSSSTFQQS